MKLKHMDSDWLQEQYYDKRLSLSQVADLAHCCPRTIVNWMNTFGMPRRTREEAQLNSDSKYLDPEWLREMYWDKGMTQIEMGRLCGTTQVPIQKNMKKLNIPTRQGGRKLYSTRLDFFETWTHNGAYMLGLLASDGSISRSERTITFKSADLELTESVHRLLGGDPKRPIYVDEPGPNKRYYRVLICSTKMVRDLIHLGITPHKTFSLKWPDIPREFIASFCSGVLNGDGCIYFKQRQGSSRTRIMVIIAMCAEHFMANLVRTIAQELGFQGSFRSYKPSNPNWHTTYRFSIEGLNAIKFLKWIYSSPCPHLQRKQAKFNEYLKWALANFNQVSYSWQPTILHVTNMQPLLTGFPVNSLPIP